MSWNPSWANAIASIESQGSGGYSAVGPTTKKGNRAYGKYQVMDFNIPTWTKKHLGQRLTPDQFLQSPEAQEAVFKGEFGSYVSKYGNPQDAASAWFTGRPQSAGANRSDVLGTTGSGYVNKFNNALGTGATSTGGQPMMQPEQKPKGLLGGLFSDPDKRARLAMALEGMTLNPNQGMMASLQGGIEQRGEDRKEAAAEAKKLAQRNKTAEFLLANGREDLAGLVSQGMMSGSDAAKVLTTASKDTSTSAMRNYDEYQRILAEKGPEAAKQFLSTIKSGTTINTGDVGQGNFIYGSKAGLPAGYRLDKRTGEASVIPGGPAEQEMADQQIKSDRQQAGGSIMGQNVLQTAKRVRELIGPYSVGYGSLLSSLPETDARELKREVDALGAIASSENLNAMREASPTGGALGNVSDKDIKLLKDKSGAIDTGSKPDQFKKQVDEYELFLLQTIHGPEAGLKIFSETRDVVPQPYPNTASTSKTKTGVSFTIIDEGKN